MFLIAPESRLRVHIEIRHGRTDRFAVTLEHDCADDDWRRVVCIDNWGGRTHRDRYRPDGTDLAHHEVLFESRDSDQALRWATEHLIADRERYVSAFLGLL